MLPSLHSLVEVAHLDDTIPHVFNGRPNPCELRLATAPVLLALGH